MDTKEKEERAALAARIIAGEDCNSVTHAKVEFEAAGYYDGDKMNQHMANNIIELLRVFSTQGHSGFSASHARAVFAKLAAFEPLGPLTGADSEWFDHGHDDRTRWQNKRCGHVFKGADGQAYDIQAVVFEEPNGSRFTGKYSHMPVVFPYTPRSIICQVPEDATEAQKQMLAERAWAAK